MLFPAAWAFWQRFLLAWKSSCSRYFTVALSSMMVREGGPSPDVLKNSDGNCYFVESCKVSQNQEMAT